ncbi:MAG: hypothetical protein AAF361_02760 [Bacteroidota bacterium]
MKKESLVVLKEAQITNNCPECYNRDMKLTFYQRHTHNRLYHRITNEVSSKIQCNKCGSVIYPVNWTDDIERIYDYYQKMVTPKARAVKFTALFYILLVLLIALAGTAYYLYKEGIIQV